MKLVDRDAVDDAVRAAFDLPRDQLAKMNADALAKKDYMAAVLTRFRLDLRDAEDEGIFLESRQ